MVDKSACVGPRQKQNKRERERKKNTNQKLNRLKKVVIRFAPGLISNVLFWSEFRSG